MKVSIDRKKQEHEEEEQRSSPQGNNNNNNNHLPKVLVGEVKAIRVDFSDAGGREEWILVTSDRLAPAEKFTGDSIAYTENLDQTSGGNGGTSSGSAGTSSGGNGRDNNNTNHRSSSIILRKASGDNSFSQPHSSVCSYPGYGACGLTNLGNTCYINSAVQCLSYMPLIRSYLVSGKYKRNGDLNRDNPLGSGGKILDEFADLLKIIWSGRYGTKQPSKFRGQLGRARTQYSAADQQDAQVRYKGLWILEGVVILHSDTEF